jgi:hypothetical protein
MDLVHWPLALSALLATAAAPGTEPVPRSCDMPAVDRMGAVQNFLGQRAVEIVDRAAQADWEKDSRLRQMVAPDAIFTLGAGDVGRHAGTGIAGARALALEMNADTYRQLGWDYIPTPVDPCSRQEVMVDFIESIRSNVFPVKFTFEAGRLVRAEGWHRTFLGGPVHGVRAGE